MQCGSADSLHTKKEPSRACHILGYRGRRPYRVSFAVLQLRKGNCDAALALACSAGTVAGAVRRMLLCLSSYHSPGELDDVAVEGRRPQGQGWGNGAAVPAAGALARLGSPVSAARRRRVLWLGAGLLMSDRLEIAA